MISEQSLCGKWEYRVGKGRPCEITVPYSTRPVGHSECTKKFDLEEDAPCTFLRFDGINYAANVTLNGEKLGEMLPYCTYIFDITDKAKKKDNVLKVELEDIKPVFGPSEGWENYGGIPRQVLILYREKQYITDIAFESKFYNDYKSATMLVTVKGKTEDGDVCRVRLYDGRKKVCEYKEKPGEAKPYEIDGVHLWSPDDPHLYRLKTDLIHNGKVVDTDTRNVGFREFTVGKRRFIFNGKPTFLTGVCYHEFVGECGHLVSPEQTEADFKTIKELGCNYVRLVHYPHNKATLDLADKMGLFVSEEPGLWWSDTAKKENHDGSIEVLKRTIRRDRTHPSIIFWLCFNECEFTEQYLVDAAKACKEADPTRLVSGANCMSLEDTPKYFHLCGFDFYTMHPYSNTTERLINSVKALNDMPLMFTEWGGYYVTDNPQLFEDFVDTMTAFWREDDDGNVLTGATYWCFADIFEFGRRRPAVKEGILREGLVDPWRKHNKVFDAYKNAFARLDKVPDETDSFQCELIDKEIKNTLTLPKTDGTAFEEFVNDSKLPIERFVHSTKRERKIEVGPKLRDKSGRLSCEPLVICGGRSAEIKAGKASDEINLICAGGPFAYPIGGEYGESIAEIRICYEDGTTQIYNIENGVDVATIFENYGPSRIRPVAENATPYLRFCYDHNHENYLLQKLTVKTDSKAKIKNIVIQDKGIGRHLLVYAISLK